MVSKESYLVVPAKNLTLAEMIGAEGMKGIILAGGTGSRLWPLTQGVSKQLLPVYNKPMIYYPLSTLMLAGIRDILVVCKNEDMAGFKRLLNDGSQYGLNIEFAIQAHPNGIPEAISIGYDFIGDDHFCLVLGDNIFYGPGFTPILESARETVVTSSKSVIFGYHVNNPSAFGVVELDSKLGPVRLVEKPANPKSSWAVTGLYFYTNDVKYRIEELSLSNRNEYEITDLNMMLLSEGRLDVELLGRGFAWFDGGTHESLHLASCFVEAVEKSQGFKIACLEEIALDRGYIRAIDVEVDSKSSYSRYVTQLLE